MAKSVKITKKDVKGYSLDQMMTKSYGKKGTKSRIAAEKKITALSKKLGKKK